MSEQLRILQNNCLIFSFAFFHRPVSPPNELLWTRCISSGLDKICDVLYAKTTFTYHGNTVAPQQPRLDLVLKTANMDQLSDVIFNIRGIAIEASRMASGPTIESMDESFTSVKENQELTLLYQSLCRDWGVMNHNVYAARTELRPFINRAPFLFNSRPVTNIRTASGELLSIKRSRDLQFEYTLMNHKGSRFLHPDRFALSVNPTQKNALALRKQDCGSIKMDTNAIKFHEFIERTKMTDHNLYIALSPRLYPNYDSLPLALQKWLHGIDDGDTAIGTNESGTSNNLDILLHGFKGFG